MRRSSRPILVLLLAAAALAPRGAAGAEVRARVTNDKGEPVPDAVVYVADVPGKSFPPPHDPYVMDQVDKEFVPHILPILVGGKVRFPNRDDIHHHVYSFSKPKKFELQLYKGEPAEPVVFDKPGVVKLGCNIHDWMSAVILVLTNPYFAVTDSSGFAVLDDVPADSTLTLQAFHERLKGAIEATAQPIRFASPGSPPVTWTLSLRPEKKESHSPFGYQ